MSDAIGGSALPPHVLAWFEPMGEPGGESEPSWSGDPGIYAQPDVRWRGDAGMRVPAEPQWRGDPGIYVAPTRTFTATPIATTATPRPEPKPEPEHGIEDMSTGDMVLGGIRGNLLPVALGGLVAGAFSASRIGAASRQVLGPDAGTQGRTAVRLLQGMTVTGRIALATAAGVASGAAAGLIAAATSPDNDDSLAWRMGIPLAVMSGVHAAAGPALRGRPGVAVVSGLLGATTGALIGGFTGANLQARANAGEYA